MQKELFEQITKEAAEMQSFLEITPSGDPNELSERLTVINVYLARSGKLLADAKLCQDEDMANVFCELPNIIANMTATVANKFIMAKCKDANYCVNWLDRRNKALVHQGDNIRTQVSFEKESLRLTKNGY